MELFTDAGRAGEEDDGPGLERSPAPPAGAARPASGRGGRPPLAERMRPRSLEEVVGPPHLVGPGGLLTVALERGHVPSLVFWGPPGCGKTTLARLLARAAGRPFLALSAVLAGVKELREVVADARHRQRMGEPVPILFVDEVHRFNRAQQDALLPHVEAGTIVLVGATTENPSFELNQALLSRLQVEVLPPLEPDALVGLLRRALADAERGLGRLGLVADDDALLHLARLAGGDARLALNLLETAAALVDPAPPGGEAGGPEAAAVRLTRAHVERAVRGTPLRYDKAGDGHHDAASALIKSMRGSDPDAAVYWLARMLEGGEDPRFVARRMVIFASEDVGNADPLALRVALDCADAAARIGLPEARINLAQGVTYLALAPKSNASYLAIDRALEAVRRHGALPVPPHLRNAPTKLMQALGHGAGYEYAHDAPGGVTAQRHLPDALADARFYEPTDRGHERELRRRLAELRALRAGRRRSGPAGDEGR